MEQLDLLAEGSASNTSNLQFLKLQHVNSCQQDVLQRKKIETVVIKAKM